MSAQPSFTERSLYWGWLPRNRQLHKIFIEAHVREPCTSLALGHKPPVAVFAAAIKEDKAMSDLFDLVFAQANKNPKWFTADPDYHVQDFEHLLKALDSVIDQPPKFFNVKNKRGQTIGLPFGVPISLIFDILGNTSAAYDLFRMKAFNRAMKKLLNSWGDFLVSDMSNTSLNDGPEGWYSEGGMAVLEAGLGRWSFQDTYKADPDTGNHQYKSWDRFFVREFNETVHGKPLRPIVSPGILPLIYNACESTTLRTAHNVQLHDTFWLKTQNYSLFDMLGGNDYPELSKLAEDFVGGSIYQAHLSPADYHRWHSPIHGRVTKTQLIDGTYFAVLPDDGTLAYHVGSEQGDPRGAMDRCQPWLAMVAARAAIIIEPLDPVLPIKKVCFLAVGMGDVSTCEIIALEDTEVQIGGQLGTFHFGGSAYVLIVQPKDGFEVVFQDLNDTAVKTGQHRWVNSVIAQIWERRTD